MSELKDLVKISFRIGQAMDMTARANIAALVTQDERVAMVIRLNSAVACLAGIVAEASGRMDAVGRVQNVLMEAVKAAYLEHAKEGSAILLQENPRI